MQPILFVLFLPQTCLHPLCRQFPPSVRFRKMFLTELIRRVGAQPDRASGIHACLVRPPDCCRTAVNRRVSSWCRVSAAGGRRLWTPGRAVRRSGRGCRDRRHDRVLQELLTGTRKTCIILTEQKDILDPDSDVLVLVLGFFVLQPSGEAVSLLENVALISGGTTGLVTWEAALYLAEWALDHQETFSGR